MSLLLTVFLGLEEEKGEKVQPRLFTVVFQGMVQKKKDEGTGDMVMHEG